MAKTNNPEGINQYTKNGGSSKPYRYSIGGYFATQKKQKELDQKASLASELSKTANNYANVYSAQQKESAKKLKELDAISNENKKSIAYIEKSLEKDLENSSKDVKKVAAGAGAVIGGALFGGPATIFLASAALGGAAANYVAGQAATKKSMDKVIENESIARKLEKDINKRREVEANNYLIASQNKTLALKEKQLQELVSKQAEDYKSVSNFKAYSSNLAKQTSNDVKQVTENIRKRMWGF